MCLLLSTILVYCFPGSANNKEPTCQCERLKEMWVYKICYFTCQDYNFTHYIFSSWKGKLVVFQICLNFT